MNPTLSDYFPPNTAYFYGYPAGTDSQFFNCVPPAIEELVSARPLVCAGPTIRIVSFAASTRIEMLRILQETGIQTIPENQIMRLPEAISPSLTGQDRNKAVTDALQRIVPDGTFMMAQPYERESLRSKYRLPTSLMLLMNDKRGMKQWIPETYLPRTFAEFQNGAELLSARDIPVPSVIKVSSSSSGDGVCVCKTQDDLMAAKTAFAEIDATIFVQEYIDPEQNYGIQFGIPADRTKPIDIIGMSRQLTSSKGEFLGGMVKQNDPVPDVLEGILRNQVLPAVRKTGWYGIGGIDVLQSKEGKYYCIDPNLRMTAMSAAILSSVKGETAGKNIISMTAKFRGNPEELIRLTQSGNADQIFRLIALRRDGDTFQFNGMLLFDQCETLSENAERALRNGFSGSLLENIAAR